MPISKGGWKDCGYDDSPPPREPTEKAKREMLAGNLQVMRNRYHDDHESGKLGVPTTDWPGFREWVNSFMVPEATRIELEAGAAQVAKNKERR